MMYRKHIMAAGLGMLVLLYAGDWLLRNALQGPLKSKRTLTARLQTTINNREKQLRSIRADGRQLQQWWAQSLPSNAEIARSLYEDPVARERLEAFWVRLVGETS